MNLYLHSTKMPFGKHKGIPMKDVPSSYKLWLLENAEDLEQKYPYLQLYLEMHEVAIRQDMEDSDLDFNYMDKWDFE